MKLNWWATVIVAIIVGFGADAALSHQRPGKGQAKKQSAGDKVRAVLPESEPVFTEEERLVISGWFHDDRGGLPPGLAKKDRLPPGLEKHLRKRGSLPPGLQKKVQPLPPTLERQLRVLPTGYRRVVVGGNVVLMNQKTALIYDILRDVIR